MDITPSKQNRKLCKMNTFVDAVNSPELIATTNGVVAFDKTGSALVDLFFKIGAARKMEIAELEVIFARALAEDKNLATRILLWARDVRGGAGERQVFRTLLKFMERNYPVETIGLIPFIPDFGRWDDILQFETPKVQSAALYTYAMAISMGNGLAAKWAPRKGAIAAKLRNKMGVSPKVYRKTIVGLTDVVEQKMCAGQWETIEFGKLPSIAAKQYQNAFGRRLPIQYGEYVSSLKSGNAKINASAIFPHDIITSLNNGNVDVAEAQWAALPNYMTGARVLPVVDVSGSMNTPVGGNTTAMNVSIALGMYISEKNTGIFNGLFSTFSKVPQLIKLVGTLKERFNQLSKAQWDMNTNISAVFELILSKATTHNVPQSEMPEYILILSDMQFDQCEQNSNNSAFVMISQLYASACYTLPKIVFWNIAGATHNVPVTEKENGTILISGFSPAILKSVLAAKNFNPYNVMMDTINVDRYSINIFD